MKIYVYENIKQANMWFHRSKTPIAKWDMRKQISGYYSGLYMYSDLNRGKKLGEYIYKFDLSNAKLYNEKDIEKNSKNLKIIANKLNLFITSGSGYWISKVLEYLGYDGIQRGEAEVVLFHPEKFHMDDIAKNKL